MQTLRARGTALVCFPGVLRDGPLLPQESDCRCTCCDETEHAERNVEHLGDQPPAGHLPNDDQHTDAGQIGGEQEAGEDERGQEPADVEGPALDPRCSDEEQHAGPQALDPAARQVNLRHPVFEYEDRVNADGGDTSGCQPVAHDGGSKDAHWIANEGLHVLAERQGANEQQRRRQPLSPTPWLHPQAEQPVACQSKQARRDGVDIEKALDDQIECRTAEG